MSRVPATAAPQPAAPARAGGLHAVGHESASAEREAERVADAASITAVSRLGWSYAAVPVSPPPADDSPAPPALDVRLTGEGRPLEPGLRHVLGTRLGTDLSALRLHDDEAAHDLARRAGAEAVTVGHDVAFAPGRLDDRTAAGRRRLAHEAAHVAQHRAAAATDRARRPVARRQGKAPVAPATTLGGLPEGDRKRIQVVTTTRVNVTGLNEKFSTKGGTLTLGLPPDTTVALDASVDKKLQHGLRNVAGALTTDADVKPPPMAPNTTVTLRLDLSPYGGIDGLYRFTWHAPPATGKAQPVSRVLVEQLGKGAPPAGTKPPPPPPGGAPAPDPVADRIKAHSINHSYTGAELDSLRAAISQVPDAHLRAVSGLTFARRSKHPTDPDAGGDYNPETHTVTMFDKVFASTQATFQQGAVATSYAARAIVHEIGHAVDLAPLRTLNLAREQADAAVAALSTKYPDPDNPGRYRYATGSEEEKDVKTTLKAQKDATAALLAGASRSGTKTVADPAGGFTDVIGTKAKGVAFREAVHKDGIAVSKYGEKDWQESYAEAYSLYVTAPDTLKALRPNTYAHLDKSLPK